jgi:hypothetical protein
MNVVVVLVLEADDACLVMIPLSTHMVWLASHQLIVDKKE